MGRVWSSVSGSYSILSPGSLSSTSLGVPASGGSATLYVEGLKGSQTVGDQSMRGSWNGLSAEVKWTVLAGDVRIRVNHTETPNDKETDPDETILGTPETESASRSVVFNISSLSPLLSSGYLTIAGDKEVVLWREESNGDFTEYRNDSQIPLAGLQGIHADLLQPGDHTFKLNYHDLNGTTRELDKIVVHQRDGSFALGDDFVVNYEGPNVSWAIDILANDHIGNTPLARIVSHSNPSRGTLTHMMQGTPEAHFLYTPNAGQFGEDLFNYTVVNDHNEYSTAQVRVVVEYRPEVIVTKINELDAASRDQLLQIHYNFLVDTTKKILGDSLGGDFAIYQGRAEMERLATVASWPWTIQAATTPASLNYNEDTFVDAEAQRITYYTSHTVVTDPGHPGGTGGPYIPPTYGTEYFTRAEICAQIKRLLDNERVLPHYRGAAPGIPWRAGVEAFVAHKNTRIAVGVAGAAVVILAGPPAWAAAGAYTGSITVGGATITAAGVAQAGVAVGTAWGVARAADDIHQTVFEGDRSLMQSSLDVINSQFYDDYRTASDNQLLSMDLATVIVEIGPGFHQMMRGAKTVTTQVATKPARELTVLQKSCFVAKTPILTPDGSKHIEEFRRGDTILSRPENDPNAAVRSSIVEEVFELESVVLELFVNGRLLETTEEHPFFVVGKGWIPAKDLLGGDQLIGHNEQLAIVEKKSLTERVAKVYNLRVLEDHTYFVGADDWGFSVWVHNNYDIVEEGGKVIVRKQGQDDVVFDNWGELFSRYRVGTRDDALKFLNAPRRGVPLPHTRELTEYLYKRINADDIVDALHANHHSMPKVKQAEILNDWEQFVRGTNYNGKQVDIFFKDGRVVITEAGDKTKVITAYGREFSANQKPVNLQRWNFNFWQDGEFYYSPIHRNTQR